MLCLRHAALLVALISATASVASATSVSDAAVERARYIVHVKVVAMEHAKTVARKFDDGKVIFEDDYAVCEIKKIVLGMVATDEDGCLRVTSDSEKSTAEVTNPVRYKVGDEFTIVADSCELNRNFGMILPGEQLHIDGKPSNELLKLLDDRIKRAEATRDALSKLLPGAQTKVEAALKEYDDASRNDFKDLTPEADLLLDYCALAQYTPDLSDLPRPALSDADRKRLTLLALRGALELSNESAEIAADLVSGTGNGAYQLLQPAAGDKALEALRRLAARDELDSVLGFLCANDRAAIAIGWAGTLAAGNDKIARSAEWALIESVESGFNTRDEIRQAFAPRKSYADCLTRAFETKAVCLAAWLMLSPPATVAGGDTVQGTNNPSDATRKEMTAMYTRVEMLQVYAFALGMRGADDADVKSIRADLDGKVHGHGKIDLSDVQDIARELRGRDKLPEPVRKIARRNGPGIR